VRRSCIQWFRASGLELVGPSGPSMEIAPPAISVPDRPRGHLVPVFAKRRAEDRSSHLFSYSRQTSAGKSGYAAFWLRLARTIKQEGLGRRQQTLPASKSCGAMGREPPHADWAPRLVGKARSQTLRAKGPGLLGRLGSRVF